MTDGEARASCYVLCVELDAPGGGDRRETFAYARTGHVLDALRQELEGKLLGSAREALAAICARGESLVIGVVQQGRLVDAVDARAFLRARCADGESAPLEELAAELSGDDAWRVGASGAPESKIVALELDEHALLSALPELEPPLLAYGGRVQVAAAPKETRTAVLELAKQLGRGKRGVAYGYADLLGEFVSRERFVDPDPPALDDAEAWLEQCPPHETALEVMKRIADRGDRDLAVRWLAKVKAQSLPAGPYEAILRERFAGEGDAPPLRPPPRTTKLDPAVLAEDARWEPIAEILRALPVEGQPAIEERLRVLSRETDDAEVAVLAFALRRHFGIGRGEAHSALMLKQAAQRSSEAVLPGLVAAGSTEDASAALALCRESAARLEARGGELSPGDVMLWSLLPSIIAAPALERAATRLASAGEWSGAAAVMRLADRVVSDPADVCAVAAGAARMLVRAGQPAEAHAFADAALRYWRAHAWMRSPTPTADCAFWHAAALAALGDGAPLEAIVSRSAHYRELAERELGRAAPAPVEDVDDGSLRAGSRVAHPKFGAGVVERVEGSGETAKVAVRFDSGEAKVLLARFVERR